MLEKLNDKQLEAVMTTEGPLLVIAGAGSGKTRVLTSRIAYLIEEKKVDPYNILAITFTNKAAKEMRDRVVNMLGPIAYQIQISTFHSFGLSIIKEYHHVFGYAKEFTILDSDDSLLIIKKIIKDMGLDTKLYNPRVVRSKISSAKNEHMSPNSLARYNTCDSDEKVVDIYKQYNQKLKANNSFDFDDLLLFPIDLFEQHPDILVK